MQGNLQGYLFLFPMLAFVLVVYLYPLLEVLYLSLHRVPNVASSKFVGLANFKSVLSDGLFLASIQHNLQLFPAVIILLVLSAFLAALLNDQISGWRFYRAVLFLPYVLPVPVVGIAFTQMLQLHGVLNNILTGLGLGFLAADWIGNTTINMYVIMWVIVWKELGFGTILFLARLLSVPRELYEAAQLDGAGWWGCFFNVTLPQLRGIAAIFAILEIFNLLSWVFGYIYTMTAGGPGYSTMVLEFYIFRKAFFYTGQMGEAAAVCTLLFFVAFVALPLRGRLEGEYDEV